MQAIHTPKLASCCFFALTINSEPSAAFLDPSSQDPGAVASTASPGVSPNIYLGLFLQRPIFRPSSASSFQPTSFLKYKSPRSLQPLTHRSSSIFPNLESNQIGHELRSLGACYSTRLFLTSNFIGVSSRRYLDRIATFQALSPPTSDKALGLSSNPNSPHLPPLPYTWINIDTKNNAKVFSKHPRLPRT